MITRIITAVIGIIVAVGIITTGGWLFGGAVLALGLLAWFEFKRMAQSKGWHVYTCTGGGGVALLLALAAYAFGIKMEHLSLYPFLLFLVALFLLLITFEGLLRHCHKGEQNWMEDVAFTCFGLLYCGLLFVHVILVRGVSGPQVDFGIRVMEYGEGLLWLVLLGTWASDTFAYFVGVTIGKHKFCKVSPKKSWEGAIGGFLGSMSVVILIGHHLLGMSALDAHILGFVIAFFAPVGDLVESVIKRCFDTKDSGKLLPGHGGVLDRFDSLLFTAPVTYYMVMLLTVLNE